MKKINPNDDIVYLDSDTNEYIEAIVIKIANELETTLYVSRTDTGKKLYVSTTSVVKVNNKYWIPHISKYCNDRFSKSVVNKWLINENSENELEENDVLFSYLISVFNELDSRRTVTVTKVMRNIFSDIETLLELGTVNCVRGVLTDLYSKYTNMIVINYSHNQEYIDFCKLKQRIYESSIEDIPELIKELNKFVK